MPDKETNQEQPPPPETPAPEWNPGEGGQDPDAPIRTFLETKGYSFEDGVEDSEILDAIGTSYAASKNAPSKEQLDEYREAQPALNDYAANAEEYHEWRKQKETAVEQQQAATDAEKKASWQPPQYDQAWEDVTQWDAENSRYVPKGRYGSQRAAEERNRYTASQAEYARKLVEAPWDAVYGAGGEEYFDGFRKQLEEDRSKLKEEIFTEIAAKAQQANLDSYYQTHKEDFFKLDSSGKPMRDASQQVILSEGGLAYQQAVNQGKEFGITRPEMLHQYALEKTALGESPPSTDTKKEDKKRKFVDRAKKQTQTDRMTDRDGAIQASIRAEEARSPDWKSMIAETEENLV